MLARIIRSPMRPMLSRTYAGGSYTVGDITTPAELAAAIKETVGSKIIEVYDRAHIEPPEGATVRFVIDSRAEQSK